MDILLTVVKLSPSLCESSHLPVLLGSYGASLSTVGECVSLGKVLPTRSDFHLHRRLTWVSSWVSDQKVLLLLQLYEKNEQSLINSR